MKRINGQIHWFYCTMFTWIYCNFCSGICIQEAFAADAWCATSICDTNWKFRKKMTIDRDQVGVNNNVGTLSNHPILVSFTGTDFTEVEAKTQSDGQDIRFTNQAGTDLDYEIERYDETNNLMAIWVEVDSLSKSADTILYMYYGNSGAVSESSGTNTWNSNYLSVYHLSETTSNAADEVKDSTGNGRHMTSNSMVVGDRVDGNFGYALDFDGNNEYLLDSDAENYLNNLESLTFEVWIKSDSVNTDRGVFKTEAIDSPGNDRGIALRYDNNGNVGGQSNVIKTRVDPTDARESAANVQTTNWQHLVISWDSGFQAHLYIDGQFDNASALSGNTAGTTGTNVNMLVVGKGALDGSGEGWDGKIGEVRISNNERGQDYIRTVFNNENSPSTFYTIGSEENAPSSSSKSIGESVGTAELPSFTKFLAPNEFPLSIENNNYAYDDFSAKKTTTLNTGEPIQIKILASDDGGGSDIKRISLYMNLHGAERELFHSNTAVSYNNYGEPTIRNSEGIFDTVDINVSPDGRKQLITFDITFAKEMPLSDVIIQVVDEVNNSVQLRASDAIQVIKATPIEETQVEPEITIPVIDPKLKAQLQLPNWIKQTGKSWSDGVISDNGFSKSLGYMIHNDVIKNEETKKIISQSTTYEDITFVIPQYLKNNAEWLENDLISDVEFVNAIQFLMDSGHINLQN